MSNSNELRKVRETFETWHKAFNTRDIETLFTLYDPEIVYANAGAPLMCGVDQIRPWYEEAFKSIEGTLQFKEEAAFIDVNMAVIVGAYYFAPPDGVTSTADAHLTGRVSLVYRRNKTGDWKLLLDMDNMPPDVTPDLFA